jgi:tetratricopeptide (TPR) repeat protein
MSCRRSTAAHFRRAIACLLAFFSTLSFPAWGQRGGLNDPSHLNEVTLSYNTAAGTGVVIVRVWAGPKSRALDRQALLRLISSETHSGVYQTTENNGQGVFTDVALGAYEVEASAVGYIGEHTELKVLNALSPVEIDLVLQRDPAAIHLDVADMVMTPKARKNAKRAISMLNSGNLSGAQRQLDEAFRISPESPDLNFLLGYLYFQKKDFTHAQTYLGTATNLNPQNAQALTLLGRTGLEQKDYGSARSALERAVLVDSENWLPHDLLADAYLHQKNFDRAQDEAQVAIAKGRSASKIDTSPAQLILGQSLVGMGNYDQGVQALKLFLEQSPRHPLAGDVRTLIAQIQEQASNPAPSDNSAQVEARLSGVDPLAAVAAPVLSMKSWQPPGVDDVKPTVATNAECPATRVIEESGKRVQEFVDDVARFAAVEDLFHQALDAYGIPTRTENRKYNYVASISEPEPGFIAVDEYRAEKLTAEGSPDQIASSGFAALALVFHPHMRDNFAMTCEGLGDWRGQASWLVHFRQRDDRPSRMQSYRAGSKMYDVGLKGRAWITADKFQIVRIEADMVNPMPEIPLLSEHQVVEYGPVPFPRKNTTLWLPKSAEIYFDFRKHRYYRRHSFDHYMLYSVDSEEKRKEPVSVPSKDAS